MRKVINWKPYLLSVLVLSLIALFFDWKIAIGFVVGTIVYFINLFLSDKKFPRLDSKVAAIGTAIGVIFLEGIITFASAVILYFSLGLYSSLSSFLALIIPNLYFFAIGMKK